MVVAPRTLPAKDPDPQPQAIAELEKLEEEMSQAYDVYIEAVRKRAEASQEDDGKPAAEPRPEPLDPRVDVLHKMDALADRTLGQPSGGEIAVRTFVWSAAFRLEPEKLLGRFERIAEFYPAAEGLDEAIDLIPDVYSKSGKPQIWIARLESIAAAAGEKTTRTLAHFAAARLHMSEDQLKPARAAFERVIATDPNSDYAALATGYIREIDHLQPGMTAPDFKATTLSGEAISLSDFRGKVVLLDFWAGWCAPCLSESSYLKAAAEKFKDEPFAILGVSLDDFREMLVGAIEQRQLPGIHTWDESARENPVAELYNAQVLPTWYLIDHNGVIRGRDPFGEELIPAIQALLQSVDNPAEPDKALPGQPESPQ